MKNKFAFLLFSIFISLNALSQDGKTAWENTISKNWPIIIPLMPTGSTPGSGASITEGKDQKNI
jgi:hypothetical protein